jgi:hypothetical protein
VNYLPSEKRPDARLESGCGVGLEQGVQVESLGEVVPAHRDRPDRHLLRRLQHRRRGQVRHRRRHGKPVHGHTQNAVGAERSASK